MLIVLNGYARSGKDALADHLVERHGFTKARFSDAICASLYALNPLVPLPDDIGILGHARLAELVDAVGWERAKDDYPEVRSLLQRQGHEATKVVLHDDEMWLRPVLERGRNGERLVVTGARFRGEADAAKRAGALIVRIHRPGTGPVNSHGGETEMDGYPFDFEVWNAGTLAELGRMADNLVGLAASRA